MNTAQYEALKRIIEGVANELDELSELIDSLSESAFDKFTKNAYRESDKLESYYLELSDAWYWLCNWSDELEISDAN